MHIAALTSLISWIEQKARSRWYGVRLALVLSTASLVCAGPGMSYHPARAWSWEVVMVKAADPVAKLDGVDPGSWLSKKVFRLTVPLIVRVLHLDLFSTLAVQYALGLLLLVLCYRHARILLDDPVPATFLATGLAFIYFGKACFVDTVFLWFDGWAYLFLVLALMRRRIAEVVLWSTLAAWTDERAFLALPIIYLFHQMERQHGSAPLRFRDLLIPGRSGLGVLAAMAAYLALRTWMQHRFGMQASLNEENLSYLGKNLRVLPLGAWTFMEGLWLLPISTAVIAIRSGQRLMLFLTGCAIAVMTAAAGAVYDSTRSGSYLVPLVFVMLAYLRHHLRREDMRLLLLFAAVVCVLFPACFVVTVWNSPMAFETPLPVELLRLLR